MAAEGLSRYLGAWEMLARDVKQRLSERPHLAAIVGEFDGLIAEAREVEDRIQKSAEDGLGVAPDRAVGGDAAAEYAERRGHRQRRGRRREVAVGGQKATRRRSARKSGRTQG